MQVYDPLGDFFYKYVWCEGNIKTAFSLYGQPAVLAPFVEKTMLFTVSLTSLFKFSSPCMCGSISRLSNLLHLFISFFLCQHHTVFSFIVNLNYFSISLGIRYTSSPTVFFFFKMVLSILDICNYYTKTCWYFEWDCIESVD